MDALFDMLLIFGVLSVLFGVLGICAGVAEKGALLWDWMRR